MRFFSLFFRNLDKNMNFMGGDITKGVKLIGQKCDTFIAAVDQLSIWLDR